MPRSLAALALIIFLSLSTAVSALSIGEIELNSALNQPFSADVPLTGSKPEELDTLKVVLASQDAFDNYGLDRPIFLNGINFRVRRTSATAGVLEMRGNAPISEPFVTLLVKFNWSAGNLLREYTVLLDPPVFDTSVNSQPVQEAQLSAPVSAATPDVAPAPKPAPIAKPAVPRSAAPPPVSRAPRFTGETYGPISTGQSLWGIANRVREGTDVSVNQMMVALYRANPEAFMGNINRMKAGSIMRMPQAADLAAIDRRAANAEVIEQNDAWRSGRPVQSVGSKEISKPAQLKLVAPSNNSTGGDGVAAAGSADGTRTASNGDSAALREELEETQRLLALKDSELQAMQQRLAALEAGEAAEEAAAVDAAVDSLLESEAEEAVADDAVSEADLEQAIADTAALEADDTDAGTDEIVAEGDGEPLAADEQSVTEDATNVVSTTSSDSGSSIFDTILGILGNIWLWIGLAVVVVVGLVFFRRKNTAPAIGSMLDDDDDEDDSPEAWEDRGAPAAKSLPEGFEPADFTKSMVVEESLAEEFLDKPDDAATDIDDGIPGLEQTAHDGGVDVAPPDDFDIGLDTIGTDNQDMLLDLGDSEVPLEKTTEIERSDEVDFTKTVGSETAINLDHSDPIAEADFHMAYGLYDQAAELLVKALDEDPDDKLMRVKLLEVYFVWENKDGFASEAHKLHEQIGDDADAEWNKVVIMGKQICPDDSLFEGEASGAGGAQILDIQLESDADAESGEMDMSFDADSGDDGLDFDFGDSSDSDDGLDFDIGGSESPTMETPTIEAPGAESPTMETPTIEAPGAESPTMETPTIEVPAAESPTVESPTIASPGLDEDSSDTESINLDDLDVDLGDFDDILDDAGTDDEVTHSSIDGDTDSEDEVTESNLGDEDATMLAGDIDFAEFALEEDSSSAAGEVELGEEDATLLADSADLTDFIRNDIAAESGIDETLEQPVVVAEGDTIEQPGFSESAADPDSLTFSDDVFGADDSHAETQAIDAVANDGSEVGTKLDLARAYIEMSDPEGARSILNEVLEEGNDSEQETARSLLDGLS